MQENKIKTCYVCKRVLLLSKENFSKNRSSSSGWKNECKDCSKKLIKKYRINNRDKIAKTIKKYKELHKDKLKQQRKIYFCKNADKIKATSKKYYNQNIEVIKEKYKKYYIKNRLRYNKNSKIRYRKNQAAMLKAAKEYNKKHKDQRNKWQRIKRKTDVGFKVRSNMSRRIRDAIKSYSPKSKKYKNTVGLLGCSIEQLRIYLESKFQNGMSWENYGYNGWQIDHIVPCSYFNLSKEEEQIKCFHYTNLQPLWAKDNYAKNGYYLSVNYRRTKVN